MKDVNQFIKLREEIIKNKLTLTSFSSLLLLSKGEKSVSELAKTLALNRTSLTDVADNLLKLGYAKEVRGKDRRKRILQITEKGRKFLNQ